MHAKHKFTFYVSQLADIRFLYLLQIFCLLKTRVAKQNIWLCFPLIHLSQMNGFSVVFDGIFTKAKTIRFELENKKKIKFVSNKIDFCCERLRAFTAVVGVVLRACRIELNFFLFFFFLILFCLLTFTSRTKTEIRFCYVMNLFCFLLHSSIYGVDTIFKTNFVCLFVYRSALLTTFI